MISDLYCLHCTRNWLGIDTLILRVFHCDLVTKYFQCLSYIQSGMYMLTIY